MQKLISQSASAHQQQFHQVLIRRKEVERLTALSRSRIYELLKQDLFPKPVRLGAMSVAWIQVEILAWIDSRIADRNKSEVKVTS